MKRFLKILGVIFGSLLVLALAFFGYVWYQSNQPKYYEKKAEIEKIHQFSDNQLLPRFTGTREFFLPQRLLAFQTTLVYTRYIQKIKENTMNTVKTRKVGNSVTVTIPKTLNVPEGQEMVVYKGADGIIVLAPKIPDPFDGTTDLSMTDDFEGVTLVDSEI